MNKKSWGIPMINKGVRNMKIEKGQPGYLKAQRNKMLIQTLVEFGMVLLILIIGILYYHTRLNVFTVVAVVGCLPASKALVELIAILPYKSVEPQKVNEIEEKSSLLTTAYDLVMTSREKIMPVDAIVISGHTVFGYAPNKKTNPEDAASYIRKTLSKNHFDKMTIKIFPDYVAFLSRVEGMQSIMEIEQSDTKKKEQAIRRILLSISM